MTGGPVAHLSPGRIQEQLQKSGAESDTAKVHHRARVLYLLLLWDRFFVGNLAIVFLGLFFPSIRQLDLVPAVFIE
jgi:hypothetical protein